MRKVLLTGFGAFGSHKENPTQIIVEKTEPMIGLDIQSQVFEVDFEKLRSEYPKILADFRPDFILNLGLSAATNVVTLENFALNTGFDAFGPRQHFQIDENLPTAYQTQMNTDFLAQKLCGKGIPALRSDHAGSYLCNFIYYHSLHYTHNNGGEALFVHIPYTTEMVCDFCITERKSFPSLPEQQVLTAVQLLLQGAAQ